MTLANGILDASALSSLGAALSTDLAAKDPTANSTLLRWYRASNIAIADAAAVSSWPDASPANDPATQGTSGQRPIYYTQIANGRPGVKLDGSDDVLNFTRVTNVQTLVMVCQLAAIQVSNYAPLLGDSTSADLSAPPTTSPWLIDNGSVPAAKLRSEVRINGVYAGQLGGKVRPSGLCVISIRVPSGQTMALSNIAKDRGVAGRYTAGIYGDVALFSSILSDQELAMIERGMANYYDIPLNGKTAHSARALHMTIGDSLQVNVGGQTSYPDQLQTLLGGSLALAVEKLAVGGTMASSWALNSLASQMKTISYNRGDLAIPQVASVYAGSNDLYNGALATNTFPSLVRLWTAMRGWGFKVIAHTLTPRSDAGVAGGFETERQALCTLIRNNPQYYDYLVDAAADATMGPAGAETNATYYQADKVHPTAAGNLILANLAKPAYTAFGF